jgi:Holliday junction DNA helicase RuvB
MVDFYPPEQLVLIIARSSKLLDTEADREAVEEIARRSRGTPRIANRLLRRVRDYAQVKGDGRLTMELTLEALKMEGIDKLGLDDLDRKYLRIIMDHYKGGPVGIETIGATLNEECDTLEDMVEPFLLKNGFVQRTARGRMVSAKAYKHLGYSPDGIAQKGLFE